MPPTPLSSLSSRGSPSSFGTLFRFGSGLLRSSDDGAKRQAAVETLSTKRLLAFILLATSYITASAPIGMLIPGANAVAIRKEMQYDPRAAAPSSVAVMAQSTDDPSGNGGFTVYQINGDGTTQTAAAVQPSGSPGAQQQVSTTVVLVSHDGTQHGHISIVGTEPETTVYVTDLLIDTDVVTVTFSEDDPDGGAGVQSTLTTHDGTWTHTHWPNEAPHTIGWTHEHLITGTLAPFNEEVGEQNIASGSDNGDGNDDNGNGNGSSASSTHTTHCSFDLENHTSEIDEQIHHTTYHTGSNTINWAHMFTTAYVQTKSLVVNGTTYYEVETRSTVIDGQIQTLIATNTRTAGDSTVFDVFTETTTDYHWDPVTTLDDDDWNEHTLTHPHTNGGGGPTEFIPSHTHQHTFTIATTITSSYAGTYTEWVSAKTITL